VKNTAPRPGHERAVFQFQRFAGCFIGSPTAIGSPTDLPVGRRFDFHVESPLQKYFASPVGQIISTTSRHPVPHRGAYRDRHERGMGCGGRGSVLRATGLQGGFLGTCERSPARGREMLQRTAKSCGPDAPMLASSLAEFKSAQPGLDKTYPRDDGGKRARSPGRARHKP
jgi:hypothetical protein